MSKTKQVGAVLVAVPLYEVHGIPNCGECPFLVCVEISGDNPEHHCRHDGSAIKWPWTPHDDCPLRTTEALTVEEVLDASASPEWGTPMEEWRANCDATVAKLRRMAGEVG